MMTFYNEYKKEKLLYSIVHDYAGPPKRYGFIKERSREFQQQIYNLIGEFAGSGHKNRRRSALNFTVTKKNTLGQIKLFNYIRGDKLIKRSRFSIFDWIPIKNEDISACVGGLESDRDTLKNMGEDTTQLTKAIDEMSSRIIEDYRLCSGPRFINVIWV
jgi:hypothetical protein